MTTKNVAKSNSESYNLIFDLAPFPMWIYDMETYEFLLVNQDAVRHYGYTVEEFLKMTIKDIRPMEDMPKLEKSIRDALIRTETYKQGLFRHQKKDGSVIYVQIKRNLIDFEGKKAGIVTAIDLTERYNQERNIEEQRQFLEVIGSIHEILLKSINWSKDLEQCFQILGEFLHVHRISFYQENLFGDTQVPRLAWCGNKSKIPHKPNPNLHRIMFADFPHFRESLQRGKSFEIIVADLPPSQTKEILQKQNVHSLLQLPVMINNEFSGLITLKDFENRRNWKENEIQLLKTLTSNLAHVIKEAQVQKQLIDNEARFRSLVQNGNDLIAIIDGLGNYKYVAQTSKKVLGISPEEFIGKSAFEYIHKEDVSRITKELEQMATKERVSLEPFRFLDAKKNWRWVQTDFTNHLSDPVIAGIVVNTKDVTVEVEKRMGEQLLASLTKSISQPASLSICLTDALKVIAELSNFSLSEVWLVSEDKSRMDLITKSGKDKCLKAIYQGSQHVQSFGKGEGLPGQVWEIQETCVLENLKKNENFLRPSLADLANLQMAIGIPIMNNEEFLGCIACFSSCQKNDLLVLTKLLTNVGKQVGALFKQKIAEEQYRSLFNISPDPHGLLGFDGYLKKTNNALAKLLGYEKPELFSKSIFHFLHPEDKAKAQARIKELIGGAAPKSFEARFLTKDGNIKWLVWNGVVIQESKIIIAVAKDITKQKEVEIELYTSNKKLKTAQKIAKLGYWYRDFTSDLSEWNEETYHIFGYTRDNFIPTLDNVTQTFHPKDRCLIEGDPRDELEPGKVQSFEHRIITASNEIKWVHQEIRMLADENQVPYRMEGTIQDITERKENELQLAVSNERFQLAIKASNEMIWEVDHKRQTIYRSSSYCKLICYSTLEPFSKENSWFRSMLSQEVNDVWNSFQEALSNKKDTFWSKEYKVLTENGSIAYLVDRCFIVRDEKGIPLRSVGSVLDVTASREQLERIKKQNDKLREIAWLQSHVIRAPLARILSLIYLMKEHEGGGKSTGEIFDLISASAEELDNVILEIINKTEAVKENDTTNHAH
ncbi:PAS domain S-box protein [Algoriphagus sp. C2-6-M1]|uniref:PAS domain S-box protein n=1 Tax=Algoriphagus persicinus TaxID=3108754 RepID=UPI002B3B2191|nr:PAS domain S-box protein [Algoriphagus sp. C2-6-M1]MEB2780498.1 PAS domain S-box protein [Algoriphagus sp. C2-6-M1]